MNHYFLHGSVILWVTVFVVGGFVEEYWRAVCVVALQQNGYNGIMANLLSAFAFLLAHLSGLPSRIRPGGAGPAMIMGLTFSGLFIWTGNLVAPCVASIIDLTMNYFQADAVSARCLLLNVRHNYPSGNDRGIILGLRCSGISNGYIKTLGSVGC